VTRLDQQDAILSARLLIGPPFTAHEIDQAIDFALDAQSAGRDDLAVAQLEPLVPCVPANAKLWQVLGLSYRGLQRMDAALAAFDKAVALAPQDIRIAYGRAQVALEAGRPAAGHFENARRHAPGDPDLALATADALQTEGRAGEAIALMSGLIAGQPGWVQGHEALVRLRTTMGDVNPAQSFAHAVENEPRNGALRIGWYRALAQAEDWAAARNVLDDTQRALGHAPELDAALAVVATETGDDDAAERLFAASAGLNDPAIALYRIRHCLRTGRIEEAAHRGEALLHTDQASATWPYLSLAWRRMGDARAAWLDGDPPFIGVYDLPISADDLSDLAGILRRLHTARAALPDQSVRGGTQTDKPLFSNIDPAIQTMRRHALDAVRSFVDGLPHPDATHPLLGAPRGGLLFEGSWSVRLTAQGFHVAHTHPAGWISSACYIALPPPESMGPTPAGWLSLGAPPADLRLDLPGYAEIEPKPGRLVLFPSTMWHATVPFNDGERLTVAFDVRTPVF
jgi:tetratricopeptide (TPR) repeat protein